MKIFYIQPELKNTEWQFLLATTAFSYYLWKQMMPDYPHKIFGDKRITYTLLMVTLAMDSK